MTRQPRGEKTRIEGPARLRVNNVLSVRDAAVKGLGIAQLPEIVAASAKRGQLVRVLEGWFIDHAVQHFR